MNFLNEKTLGKLFKIQNHTKMHKIHDVPKPKTPTISKHNTNGSAVALDRSDSVVNQRPTERTRQLISNYLRKCLNT